MRWISLAVFFSVVISTNNSSKQYDEEWVNNVRDISRSFEEYTSEVGGEESRNHILQQQLDDLRDFMNGNEKCDSDDSNSESMALRKGRETFGKDQLSIEEFDAKLIEMLKFRFLGFSETQLVEEYSRLLKKASVSIPHAYMSLDYRFNGKFWEPELSTEEYLNGMLDLIGNILREKNETKNKVIFYSSLSNSESGTE